MIVKKLFRLLARRKRSKKLGVPFRRTANMELPSALGHLQPLNLPSERGMVAEFVNIILNDCYGLEQLQKKTSNPNLKILDVGANVGLFSLAARLNFPQAVIHAYEPNPNLASI